MYGLIAQNYQFQLIRINYYNIDQQRFRFSQFNLAYIFKLRSKLMRPKKIIKPKQPNLLEEESLKLKQKLELLKQQVTQKKIEKQMNKTSHSNTTDGISNFLKTNNQNQTQYPSNDKKLYNALSEMKLQNIEAKLAQKGVSNFYTFMDLQQAQIDQWKDILVGHRIRMKKFIKVNKSEINKQQSPTLFKKQQPICSDKIEQKNIEDIIKSRQKKRIFVPMARQIQQNQIDWDNQEMTQHDQDVIIKSFMNIFQPRKGILRRPKKKCTQSVKWSQQVQKMQAQFKSKQHIKYPKQSIARQALKDLRSHDNQRASYCWKCIKKIQKTTVQRQGKIFCSQDCSNNYQQQRALQLKILQQSKNQLVYKNDGNVENAENRIKDELQDIQLIDLSIL